METQILPPTDFLSDPREECENENDPLATVENENESMLDPAGEESMLSHEETPCSFSVEIPSQP